MKTYSKQIIKSNQDHIVSFFETQEDFINQVKALKGSNYQAVYNMAQDGFFYCYYDQAKEYIKELLNETEEEAARYSDDEAWQLYCHLLARDGSRLVK